MNRYIRALRPEHWIKNGLVLAAFFFALGDPAEAPKLMPLWRSLLYVLSATAIFCVVSSGVYVLNDTRDVELDRLHPTKQWRPIASGAIRLTHARLLAFALLILGMTAAHLLSPRFGAVAGAYVLLQVAYSLLLKRIALLDVLTIAVGFVLRALAGAVVICVSISPWLVLCTFMLALFLGFCKRRHEKVLLSDLCGESRPSLVHYDERLLDMLIAIAASATIVSYALYTLSPETIHKFGSSSLGFSIPFVVFGIFRYLDLVYREQKGDRPEKILLTDLPILVDVALFGIAVLYILHQS